MSLIKECAESLLRTFRILKIKNKGNESYILSKLKNDGIFVEPNFISSEQCESYKAKIDKMISERKVNVWSDDKGADNRIYFVNEIDDSFNTFYNQAKIRYILAGYTGTASPQGMLLAARIDYKEGNKGSGEGWHRDSPITHQFKAICYLNDVNEDNGCFQYIKTSHSKFVVIKNYLKRTLLPGKYRFEDNEIENYLLMNNQEITDVTGEAGSIVYADTKGIHRGKPLKTGTRYVLFCYFWHNDIPPHFAKLKQE
jgi:hypothetical protein